MPFIIAFLSALVAASPATAAGIERASAELVAPGVYRIDLSATADAWPVAIFPSSRADAIDAGVRPVTTRTTTVHVRAPGRQRVYFHLQPAAGRARVVALRHIPLDGALNLRDLGGYRTTDGRHVKWGLVYRSDNLATLTAADYETLNSLGLRLICDLRTPSERERAPTRWQGRAAPAVMIAIDRAPTTPSPRPAANSEIGSDDALRQRLADVDGGRASPAFDPIYPDLALRHTPTYKALFARLVSGDLPTLTHCTAGQDRTGIFAAVLLLALGVPQDTVMEDYLLTNRYRRSDEHIEAVRVGIQKRLGLAQPPSFETVRWMEDSHPSYLNLGLAAIEKEYGGFPGYLRKGLGLSASQLQQLRSRLLEY